MQHRQEGRPAGWTVLLGPVLLGVGGSVLAVAAGLAVAVGLWAASPAGMAAVSGGLLAAVAILLCSRDIAQARHGRLSAEAALHDSVDVLRSMVSTLPLGVVTVDRHGRVEIWNQAAEAILGYSGAEMTGRPPPAHVFATYADNSSASDVFLRMVTGGQVKGEEVQCRRKDGSMVDARVSGAPLVADNDRLRGAICLFEDISERKAIADQLQQAQKMEAVGQLTGGLAHDFNNILGIAIGNLDLLDAEISDHPEAAELVAHSLAALLRGAELTRALLAFSRRQPLQPSRVEAAELLGGVARMLGRTLGEQVEINLLVEGRPFPVFVDPALLGSAITNLAINARDAMADGGTLTIASRNVTLDADYVAQNPDARDGDHLLIEVTDTGAGMPPEVLARVFEPFFTTKPTGRGTGLGLSMVFGFIKQSGGHIRVYSEIGIGTTVRLYLPRAEDEHGVAVESEAAPPLVGGSETVLLVEDNDDVRRMAQAQLTRLGYRVVTATCGAEALEILAAEASVALLFTDVVMPGGMTGFQLVEEARLRRPDLKVLVTSGFPGTTLELPRRGDGAWAFLGKPYRKQDLARMVRETLDGKG